MSSVVNSAGWHVWDTGDERTSNVLFGEVGNSGVGASGTRAKFATKLKSPVLIESILGSRYVDAGYFDSDFLS